MKQRIFSIGKFEQGCINEDAAVARKDMIAVSDGAGGGGLFAERWSHYLLDNLPDAPICNADELDEWIGRIWEPFYNDCEESAKELGGMSLEKFYDEGSFATLVAVWRTASDTCRWMSFGDSVAFHYNKATKQLEHSFSHLCDFDEPPFLINCKDELNKDGFRCGTFHTDRNSVVFAASDALSHYIIMMYEVSRKGTFREEIEQAINHHSKNENYIKAAMALKKFDFETDVLRKLQKCIGSKTDFQEHIKKLIRLGLLAHDDYSFTLMHTRKNITHKLYDKP
jgi:hypothetical protein